MSLRKILKDKCNLFYILKSIYRFFKSIPKCFKIITAKSYFPEKKRKNFFHRLFDMVCWAIKYKEINRYYNLYGLDLKGSKKISCYYPYNRFMTNRSKYNHVNEMDSQTVLLRDKYQFYKFMKANGFPVPEIKNIILHNNIYDADLIPVDISSLSEITNVFLKSMNGSCGKNVERITDFEELKIKLSETNNYNFIIQDTVEQHPVMQQINPHSVNTLRIITVNKNDSIYLFGALLRIGTSLSKERDNTSQGGIAVQINADGTLKELGFRKPQFGGITNIHPETGIEFNKFNIPFYSEAVNLCCKAHHQFYNIRCIGWDIAITQEGPIFIEGNDDWELMTIQAMNGGLSKQVSEIFTD